MLYKKSLLELSQFCLAGLIFMMNVNGNNFFHLKELFFAVFVLISLSYADFRHMGNFLMMISLYLLSAVFNLFTEPEYQVSAALYYMLGFIYLFLQVFETSYYRQVIVKSFIFSAAIVAVGSICVWILCISSPVLATAITFFFESNKTDVAAFIFLIRERDILGIHFYGVFYCTAPCMICGLGYSLFRLIDGNCGRYKFLSVLFAFALVISAARANILAVLMLYFVFFFVKLLRKGYLATAVLIMTVAAAASIIILLLMLNQKDDSSIKVKTLHKLSYLNLFKSHPYKTLFGGWGAGSEFYSMGFRKMTNTTELSLYETVRRYGVLSSIFILFFIWCKPVVFLVSNKLNMIYTIYLSLILVAYFCVACTNPFLLGSIGFCSLIFMEVIIQDCIEKQQKSKIGEGLRSEKNCRV